MTSRGPVRVGALLFTALMCFNCQPSSTSTPPLDGTDAAGAEHNHEHEAEAGTEHDHGHEAEAGTEHEHEHDAEAGHQHLEEDGEHIHGAACVRLSDVASENLGIQVQTVKAETYYHRIKIPGMATVDPDSSAAVSAPTTVRILSLDTPPHATVRPGQRLARLELADADVRNLQIRAVEARAELLAVRTDWERAHNYLAGLQDRGAEVAEERRRVEGDLAVLDARLQSHQSALAASLASLRASGLSEAQISALEQRGEVTTELIVYAPRLPGAPELEVVSRPVQQGQTLPAGGLLYELVALNRLLVIGEAFEADLEAVRKAAREGLPTSVLFPVQDVTVDDLRILTVAGMEEADNRTTHVHVRLPNELMSERVDGDDRYLDWRFRAGSQVQLLVATEEAGRKILIPSCALVREGGHTWVFRKTDAEYEREEVRVESASGRTAVLPEGGGLSEGDEVVVVGALQLQIIHKQQESGGGAVDPHAGHNH